MFFFSSTFIYTYSIFINIGNYFIDKFFKEREVVKDETNDFDIEEEKEEKARKEEEVNFCRIAQTNLHLLTQLNIHF